MLGPIRGLCPVIPAKLMWSLIIMISPTVNPSLSPPAALVTISTSTPSCFISCTGLVTYDSIISDLWQSCMLRSIYAVIHSILLCTIKFCFQGYCLCSHVTHSPATLDILHKSGAFLACTPHPGPSGVQTPAGQHGLSLHHRYSQYTQ